LTIHDKAIGFGGVGGGRAAGRGREGREANKRVVDTLKAGRRRADRCADELLLPSCVSSRETDNEREREAEAERGKT